jgi:hypothetical protein
VTLPPGSTDSRLRFPSFGLRQSIEIPPFCSCFPNLLFSSSCLYCSCSSQSLFLQRVRTSWGCRIHRPSMEPSAQGEPSTSASVCSTRVDFYFCCHYLPSSYALKNLMFRYYLGRLGIKKIFCCHDRYGMRQHSSCLTACHTEPEHSTAYPYPTSVPLFVIFLHIQSSGVK